MELEHDLDAVPERVAQASQRHERAVHLVGRDVLVPAALRGSVERPDLDALDPVAIHDLAHDLLGLDVEVVPQREAGVVDRHSRVRAPADQAPDGRAERLAEEVPERQVDRGENPHLGPAADLVVEGPVELAPDPLDVPGVAPEETARDLGVDESGLGRVAGVGLAQAHEAGVGVEAQPGPVGPERRVVPALPVDGVDAGDAHLRRVGGGAPPEGGEGGREKNGQGGAAVHGPPPGRSPIIAEETAIPRAGGGST